MICLQKRIAILVANFCDSKPTPVFDDDEQVLTELFWTSRHQTIFPNSFQDNRMTNACQKHVTVFALAKW